MSMTVAPTAAVLGAESAGLDLSRPVDDPTFAAIERAYNEYGVIFLPRAVDHARPAGGPLSPEAKHQVLAGGALGFYGLG
jgi:alpha-ketoglutarate-dependent taurine dioxygenase